MTRTTLWTAARRPHFSLFAVPFGSCHASEYPISFAFTQLFRLAVEDHYLRTYWGRLHREFLQSQTRAGPSHQRRRSSARPDWSPGAHAQNIKAPDMRYLEKPSHHGWPSLSERKLDESYDIHPPPVSPLAQVSSIEICRLLGDATIRQRIIYYYNGSCGTSIPTLMQRIISRCWPLTSPASSIIQSTPLPFSG